MEKINISILYVEDEKLTRNAITEILTRRISKIYTAENGEEGLKIFEKRKPDLVLADIKMPGNESENLDQALHILGYFYLQNKEVEYALKLFKLNCELYPAWFNAFDSYGEGLLVSGDTLKA